MLLRGARTAGGDSHNLLLSYNKQGKPLLILIERCKHVFQILFLYLLLDKINLNHTEFGEVCGDIENLSFQPTSLEARAATKE